MLFLQFVLCMDGYFNVIWYICMKCVFYNYCVVLQLVKCIM